MAWNPHPKVADCRDIAKKWNAKQVIVIGINQDNGSIEWASYGETRKLCDETKHLGEVAHDAVYREFEI